MVAATTSIASVVVDVWERMDADLPGSDITEMYPFTGKRILDALTGPGSTAARVRGHAGVASSVSKKRTGADRSPAPVVHELEDNPPPLAEAELEQGREFLTWLADDHFTFLGYREYQLEQLDGDGGLTGDGPGGVEGGDERGSGGVGGRFVLLGAGNQRRCKRRRRFGGAGERAGPGPARPESHAGQLERLPRSLRPRHRGVDLAGAASRRGL